jgi:dTDP-4-dehydrorhamnose 3,5-epimerase
VKVTKLELGGLYLLEPEVFEDERGFFFESFNQAKFEQAIGRKVTFVQDNHSRSSKGILRGLHYQDPKPQGKLIRVIQGEIFDVAVDIRPDSPTYGKWLGNYLSADNKKQHWIPEGFAHGFLVVSDFAEVLYKTTDYYAPEFEKCIAWDDQALSIKWPLNGPPKLSRKDQMGSALSAR